MIAEFSTYLRIFDVTTFVSAAQERARNEGVDENDVKEMYNESNLDNCLIMLLDPSTLPGCEILESNAEIA
ncbi:hypothetical protein [Ochrobactrum soli]|uniref:Uncharacterized protein n=1 Tax=Ochrobactrum soli TaxID=2448455 RepID=A0A2P9HMZ9_9HYPH|nr:hypothetical protein [[Ochrobactrum] soli]SPL65373.1 hypothetical protein OHAE_1240 [[Ochrobactrum] soli]